MRDHNSSWKRYLSLHFLASKVREKGILECIGTLRTTTFKFFQYVLWLIPLPLLYLLKIRFLSIKYLYAIGHLAVEPDCYVKEEILGIHPRYTAIMLAPVDKVANRHLLEYWRQYIRIITSPTLSYLLYPLSKLLQYDITQYVMNDHTTALIYAINTKWAGKPALLSLRESDRQRGWDHLRKLGLPGGAWFVCVHGREPGGRPQDPAHIHRDVDIYTYIPAMESVVERGGWCIRMGDPAMKPLPPMKNVIDYAHHSVRSDWMDVFLCASCRFFLGCNGGLNNLACVFGVPCALANLIPMSVLPCTHRDIGIPKLIWSCSAGRYLTFKEVLDSPMGNANSFADTFEKAGIKIVDSSPDDIRDLALEMLDRTEGGVTYTASDESLQQRFKSLFKQGHYGYGASSRIGRNFLHKYVRLLPDEDKVRDLSP